MRILALYPSLPYPIISGTKLRGATVLDILLAEHEVTFASLLSNEDSVSDVTSWDLYSKFTRPPHFVSRPDKVALLPAGKELRNCVPRPLLGMPHWMEYFDLAGMWNYLASLDLQSFGAVHVRYPAMTPYALALKRAAPHLHLVVDLDDILSTFFWRKLAVPRKLSEVRTYFWHLRELLKMYAFESGPLRRFDSVWVCSKTDLRKIVRRAGKQRGLVVANVVNAAKLASIQRSNVRPALLFVADFNYYPNSQAARFFVTKVWPSIRARIPEAEVWLVGPNQQAGIQEWDGTNGIVVTGIVESVSPYLERAMISIAPLLLGTGTRLKILEALGVGLAVVTTTIGVEGIDAQNEVDLLIADTAEDFAAQCIRLISDPGLRERLAVAGKLLVKDKYDISAMAASIRTCYDRLYTTPDNLTSVATRCEQ